MKISAIGSSNYSLFKTNETKKVSFGMYDEQQTYLDNLEAEKEMLENNIIFLRNQANQNSGNKITRDRYGNNSSLSFQYGDAIAQSQRRLDELKELGIG